MPAGFLRKREAKLAVETGPRQGEGVTAPALGIKGGSSTERSLVAVESAGCFRQDKG